jgi:menaquinone-dependent protoporphyrinogen oxidase
MTPVLVAYATRHGSTREVAAAIAARLRVDGIEAELRPAHEVTDVQPYRGVIVGGALYTGRWHKAAVALLRRHCEALASRPLAVFALGPRTLEPADLAASRQQLLSSLAKVPELEPYAAAVFGGVIDPKTFHFPLNRIHASDARDWDAIDAFAADCAAACGFGKPAGTVSDRRIELQQTPR